MAYWIFFFLALTPFVIFSVKPHHSVTLRFGRLWICLLLLWVFPAFFYSICKDYQFIEASTLWQSFCDMDGYEGTYRHWGLMAWSYGAVYIFAWEMLWRRRYRRHIKSYWHGMEDDPYTKLCLRLTCIFAVPWTLFMLVTMAWLIVHTLSTS